MNQSLRRTFKAAVASATLFTTGVYTVQAAPPPSSEGRRLTPGEVRMNVIFGDEVDSSIVRLHAGPSKGGTIATTHDTGTIAFYGHPYLSLDYSKDPSPVNYGSQIHEMTHIWQFQTGWTFTDGHCPGGYHYKLKPNSRLEDFCSESQAAIVEDYARRFLRPQGQTASNWYVDMCGYDTPQHDALLRTVVETRFPGAKRERERLGRSTVAPGAKERPANAPPCPLPGKDKKKKDNHGHDGDEQPDDGQPPQPRRTGQPVYFCDKLDFAFTRMKGIAYKQGFTAWPGFGAETDKRLPNCNVTVMGDTILALNQHDFNASGDIKPESMNRLANVIVRFTPPRIAAQLRSNLPTLFNDLVEQKRAEKNALRHIKSKEEAQRVLKKFQLQLVGDPSLPTDSRNFIQEKIRIVQGMIDTFNGKRPTQKPPVKKPSSGGPQGQGQGSSQSGGAARPTPRPASPQGGARPIQQPQLTPDTNIKNVLDKAFGATPAPTRVPARRAP